ncbi:MAG: hypothetical protein HZB16_19945 [Armatimonadetes bacterium]|nr:hypothetical protein [Armatimonadota bacterium]
MAQGIVFGPAGARARLAALVIAGLVAAVVAQEPGDWARGAEVVTSAEGPVHLGTDNKTFTVKLPGAVPRLSVRKLPEADELGVIDGEFVAYGWGGRFLIAVTQASLTIWGTSPCKLVATLPEPNLDRFAWLRLSPDGRILATSHEATKEPTTKLWQVPTGILLGTVRGWHPWFSADGQYVLTDSVPTKTTDERVPNDQLVYTVRDQRLLLTLPGRARRDGMRVMSPDSTRLATGQPAVVNGNQLVRPAQTTVYRLPGGELQSTVLGLPLLFATDGKTLVTDAANLCLFDPDTGKLLRKLEAGPPAFITETGLLITSGHLNGQMILEGHDLPSGEVRGQYTGTRSSDSQFTASKWLLTNTLAQNSKLWVWNLETGKLCVEIPGIPQGLSLDGQYVVATPSMASQQHFILRPKR